MGVNILGCISNGRTVWVTFLSHGIWLIIRQNIFSIFIGIYLPIVLFDCYLCFH